MTTTRGVLLLGLAISAGFFLALGLFLRANQSDTASRKLCQAITRIIREGDTAIDSIAYYREHPDELARAHAQNRRTLEQLPC